MPKHLLKVIRPHVKLYRDEKTGLAWVENGEAGIGRSCHPNIDVTGSVKGMKKLYWGENAEVVRSHGFHHCISRIAASDGLDYVAAFHCRCGGKHPAHDTEFFLQLLGAGYYDGPHGVDAFKNDILGAYGHNHATETIFDHCLAEHTDLATDQRVWLEETIGDFVEKI